MHLSCLCGSERLFHEADIRSGSINRGEPTARKSNDLPAAAISACSFRVIQGWKGLGSFTVEQDSSWRRPGAPLRSPRRFWDRRVQ